MADNYPCFWRYQDQSGGYYWIYYAANGEAIARSSESYSSIQNCDHSVALMRQCEPRPYYYS